MSKTIIAPRSDLTMSLMTVRRGVPGDTFLMKSNIDLSFSGVMLEKGCFSIYNFMWIIF